MKKHINWTLRRNLDGSGQHKLKHLQQRGHTTPWERYRTSESDHIQPPLPLAAPQRVQAPVRQAVAERLAPQNPTWVRDLRDPQKQRSPETLQRYNQAVEKGRTLDDRERKARILAILNRSGYVFAINEADGRGGFFDEMDQLGISHLRQYLMVKRNQIAMIPRLLRYMVDKGYITHTSPARRAALETAQKVFCFGYFITTDQRVYQIDFAQERMPFFSISLLSEEELNFAPGTSTAKTKFQTSD
jgi:hypothetical protein